MKILCLYSRIEKNFKASGEAKKAMMQVDALKELGADAEIYIHNQCIPLYKIRIRLPSYRAYSKSFRKKLVNYSIANRVDAIYIRKHIIDASLIKLTEELARQGIKIIYEIPTYPYDMEWSQLRDWPLLYREKHYRRKISAHIDRIVTYSNDNEIFGVKCINSSNGIDSKAIPIKKAKNQDSKTIILLGVATLEKWHGYDRLIRGLSKYYKNEGQERIEFHIVGEGAELNNLKKLVSDLEVDDYVIFHGYMHGQDLTDMFDRADIGVGSLGMYRIGLYNGYTLKLREYMARGIPFIYAYDDALIESTGCQYSLKFSNSDAEIDVGIVLDFYRKVYQEDNLQTKMHDIAEKYLTWKSQMKPVVDYLNKSIERGD